MTLKTTEPFFKPRYPHAMALIRIALFPLALIYQCVTDLRNVLYEFGLKKSTKAAKPAICVGNLTVGGTGKTPHVEYLIQLLKPHYKLATLSRGYGRKTKGFLLASPALNAADLGDEPMQFYQKFGQEVYVAVGEKRVPALVQLTDEHPDVELILLDDAFQHRALKPHFNLLLTDYRRLFYQDFVLPAGRLRESRRHAKRANAVVVTKCPPHLSPSERCDIQKQVRAYTPPETPVFFTYIRYGLPLPLWTETPAIEQYLSHVKDSQQLRITLVTGIAHTQPLTQFLRQHYTIKQHFSFKDHHHYSPQDLKNIQQGFQKQLASSFDIILTTEKDAVKWQSPELAAILQELPVYYLPIEIDFLADKEEFDALIVKQVKKYAKQIENF